MKRIFVVLLSLVLLLGLLPTHVQAADRGNVIESVWLRLDVPVVGEAPDTVVDCWPGETEEDLHYDVIDLSWSPSPWTFTSGTSYTVTITLMPKEGYSFASSINADLNGGSVTVTKDGNKRILKKTYSSAKPRPVTIYFDANGHGTPPAPCRIPYGETLMGHSYSEQYDMENTDGYVFAGWGLGPYDERDVCAVAMNTQLFEDTTFYAIWMKPQNAVNVYVIAPRVGEDGSGVSLRGTTYDNFEFDCYGLYSDSGYEHAAGTIQAGKTYYGWGTVTPDTDRVFTEDSVITLNGATKRLQVLIDGSLYFHFTVKYPSGSTISTVRLYMDTVVPGASATGMAPETQSLSPGVAASIGDWWDSLDSVGNYDRVYGGSFIPGNSYYTRIWLNPASGFQFAESLSIAFKNGATVARYQNFRNYAYVDACVKVPACYALTVATEGGGRLLFERYCGTHRLIDFAFVPAGTYVLTAIPDQGKRFVGWYQGTKLLSTNPAYTLKLKKDVDDLKAVFTGDVDRIDISVPIPAPGDEFNFLMQDAGAKITNGAPVILRKNAWYSEWGVTGCPLPLEAGRAYFLELEFEAGPGATLTQSTEVYINGVKADLWAKANVILWYACSKLCYMNPFQDVKESQYFFKPVMWAISHTPPITGGTDATHFSPNDTCTREQVVTFLYAALGKPEPSGSTSPFSDVKPGAYYYNPVLWAVEKGVTGGVGGGKFGVGESCTREQVVTFLWNALGKPEPSGSTSPFSDVKPGAYYFKPVLWAVENNVTGGVGDGKFGVNESCTRGQIVTFLYAAIGKNE